MKGLKKHLSKCEIEYIANNGGGYPNCIKGLAGDYLLDYLIHLGFKVKEILHPGEIIYPGEYRLRWACMRGGVSVALDSWEDEPAGFVVSSAKNKKRKRQSHPIP
jgi:hypothetical protein